MFEDEFELDGRTWRRSPEGKIYMSVKDLVLPCPKGHNHDHLAFEIGIIPENQLSEILMQFSQNTGQA